LETTGEGSFVFPIRFTRLRVPELAIGAVAVPAEVAVGDALHRKKLEAAQQAVVLRHFDTVAENLNRHKSLVWLKKIVVNQACSIPPFWPQAARPNFARKYNCKNL
jgi:hypothetical protein